MFYTKVSNFIENIDSMLETPIKYHEPINITTEYGKAVIINEKDYHDLMKTLFLTADMNAIEEIKEGMRTPLDECFPESEVKW